MGPDALEDADVPSLAVEGLNEATRRAQSLGVIVVVRDGQLVKLDRGEIEIVKTVPGRRKVATRVKKIER